jgi:hypothetical protein
VGREGGEENDSPGPGVGAGRVGAGIGIAGGLPRSKRRRVRRVCGARKEIDHDDYAPTSHLYLAIITRLPACCPLKIPKQFFLWLTWAWGELLRDRSVPWMG